MSVKQSISDTFSNLNYYRSRVFAKKLWYRYYLNNWFECRNNQELLKKARIDIKFIAGTDPLISVIVPTYNRSKLLTEVTIPSVLAQTYKNFELIVVGDHCTDDTAQRVMKIDDNRVKFVNLPTRGRYPKQSFDRWMVAGSIPRNKGLELASGYWIAPLDDDDEFTVNHLQNLLSFAAKGEFEMVYGKVQMEIAPDKWVSRGCWPLTFQNICHQGVLYHSRLNFFRYDVNAWKYNEPDDWNLWRRMKDACVKMGFLDQVVAIHHKEFGHLNI